MSITTSNVCWAMEMLVVIVLEWQFDIGIIVLDVRLRRVRKILFLILFRFSPFTRLKSLLLDVLVLTLMLVVFVLSWKRSNQIKFFVKYLEKVKV